MSFWNFTTEKVFSSFLLTGQINTYCQNIKEFNAQNLGKLFMAQALQDYNNWRNFAMSLNRKSYLQFYTVNNPFENLVYWEKSLVKQSCWFVQNSPVRKIKGKF